MNDPATIAAFITAGHAVFTLTSAKTGRHLTYKVDRPQDDNGEGKRFFVSVLTGPDNTRDYAYLGMLRLTRGGEHLNFHHTKGSLDGAGQAAREADSFKAFDWMVRCLDAGHRLPDSAQFQHAGQCGRCGRQLTTPESIATGLGPVCAGKV